MGVLLNAASASVVDKNSFIVIKKLEDHAESILQFMAANGLVAKPTKTLFLMIIVV